MCCRCRFIQLASPLLPRVGSLTASASPSYTTLTWWRAAAVLTKIQLGMGVLGEYCIASSPLPFASRCLLTLAAFSVLDRNSGIPQVFSTVGMVPGIIMLLVIAAMVSWSSYVIARFKVVHPEVSSSSRSRV